MAHALGSYWNGSHRIGNKMEILSETIFKQKINSENSGKIVVQMSTSWCGPCKKMKVMLDSLSSTYDDITLAYLDIGECSTDFSNVFNIKSVPTTVFFEDSKIVNTHIGVPVNKESLDSLIRSSFEK